MKCDGHLIDAKIVLSPGAINLYWTTGYSISYSELRVIESMFMELKVYTLVVLNIMLTVIWNPGLCF